MKPHPLLAKIAATGALATLTVASADAQQRPVPGLRITLPSHANHFSWERHHGFHGGVFIVEREVPVIVEREVVRETPPPPAAVPLPEQAQGGAKAPPRKPYVIGSTYASLPPQGCMKLIEDGASYYFCSGEWYRQLGTGRVAKYRAVARP
jgi:hypothetical protein